MGLGLLHRKIQKLLNESEKIDMKSVPTFLKLSIFIIDKEERFGNNKFVPILELPNIR
jgi:hypothetical protein